jgi:3-carboxy-cis,cis-muconate cycloisomerase
MEAPLVDITRHLRQLIEENRHQPQIGRTFLQHATATTFGMRVATWLAPLLDHVHGIRALAESLPVQLGGPVGNLAAYGEKGTDVVVTIAGRLDLRAPEIAWHTDRSVIWRLAELVRTMFMTLEKIATDVSLLAASDVEELLVRSGGSSSITGKRNPIDAIRVMASAAVGHGAVEMITRARPHELDRGVGSWHAEWVGIPLMFRSAGAAIEASGAMFETMEVDDAAMTGRVDAESARSLGDLDQRPIDAVLTRFDEVIGRR